MSLKLTALTGALLCAAVYTSSAFADENVIAPLGLYIGGAFGRANVRVNNTETRNLFSFDEPHAGWKALVGIRPLPPLGGELEYIDFGHPDTTLGPVRANARNRAVGLVAVGYLPIPVIDVFGKAGVARVQTIAHGVPATPQQGTVCSNSSLSCLFDTDHTDTRFAYGAGAQVKLNRLGIRAEYERISARWGPKLSFTRRDLDVLSGSISFGTPIVGIHRRSSCRCIPVAFEPERPAEHG